MDAEQGRSGETQSEAAIETVNLRKVYRSSEAPKTALHGLDLTVPTGAIFGLLGPNGAGKSTFINILAGTVLKSSGVVRIWGFDQDVNPRMSRASIGVVPQELNIDPFLTPAEALEVQAGLYGVPKQRRRTMALLDALGLGDKAHAHARTLSGGMKRRLLVAKAMVHSPPVIVLDEPTAGVDVELRRTLWSFIADVNKAGATIILTTHYLEEAEEMCDRIAIINHGRLVDEAPTGELLTRLDRKTAVIRGAAGSIEVNALRSALGDRASVALRPDGSAAITFAPRQTRFADLLAAIDQAGIVIGDLTTEDPDLEDVFLELTRSGEETPRAAEETRADVV
ncbi:MAG: ABC transporter ATP-binding protein [Neomegalonema sp.]|nr:ABC transporter ATP-binding protein [Neomegalonema sp.]